MIETIEGMESGKYLRRLTLKPTNNTILFARMSEACRCGSGRACPRWRVGAGNGELSCPQNALDLMKKFSVAYAYTVNVAVMPRASCCAKDSARTAGTSAWYHPRLWRYESRLPIARCLGFGKI